MTAKIRLQSGEEAYVAKISFADVMAVGAGVFEDHTTLIQTIFAGGEKCAQEWLSIYSRFYDLFQQDREHLPFRYGVDGEYAGGMGGFEIDGGYGGICCGVGQCVFTKRFVDADGNTTNEQQVDVRSWTQIENSGQWIAEDQSKEATPSVVR